MVKSFLTSASLSLFWMFSPDALVIAGNATGQGGWYFFLLFLFALLLVVWSVWVLHPSTTPEGLEPSSEVFIKVPGSFYGFTLLTLSVGCCLSLVLFIPTGTLVTAGFTFNETFLYWFPNFGFSYLLLVAVLLIHLWSDKLAEYMQLYFFSTAFCCLSILAFYGLATGFLTHLEIEGVTQPASLQSYGLLFFTALLLFLGHDQVDLVNLAYRFRISILLCGVAIIILWCGASLLHVPQNKLASSTIPYILGAREILGQPGRILMGVTVIFGTLSVVNGLFIYGERSINKQLIYATSGFPFSNLWRRRIFALFVTLVIGILLAAGVAGEEKLEIYIYGSLLLWLLFFAGKIVCALREKKRAGTEMSKVHYLLPVLLLYSFCSLVISYSDRSALLLYLGLVLLVAAVMSAALLFCFKQVPAHSQIGFSTERQTKKIVKTKGGNS